MNRIRKNLRRHQRVDSDPVHGHAFTEATRQRVAFFYAVLPPRE